jgi:hypothetical protein
MAMDKPSETRQCPYCKEQINADAVKCKYCGSSIAPERPAHGGICPYCKEQIHPEAIKCKHCKSTLVGSGQFTGAPDVKEESLLRQVMSTRSPTGGTYLPTSAALIPARRLGNNTIVVGGPIDPGDPLPCEGHYECLTICLPRLGCGTICIWVCEIV